MRIKPSTIQKELQSGITIAEVCTKYNITFEQLCHIFHGYTRRTNSKRKRVTPSQYIQCRCGHYYLRKSIYDKKKGRNVTRPFGTYETLEDAIKMREAQKKIGWKVTHVDRLCQELGIERCRSHLSTVRYH